MAKFEKLSDKQLQKRLLQLKRDQKRLNQELTFRKQIVKKKEKPLIFHKAFNFLTSRNGEVVRDQQVKSFIVKKDIKNKKFNVYELDRKKGEKKVATKKVSRKYQNTKDVRDNVDKKGINVKIKGDYYTQQKNRPKAKNRRFNLVGSAKVTNNLTKISRNFFVSSKIIEKGHTTKDAYNDLDSMARGKYCEKYGFNNYDGLIVELFDVVYSYKNG